MMAQPAPQFIFDDPRLRMTVVGRIAVRTLGLVAEMVTVVAALDFILSDIPWVKWSGGFLLLVIADRVIHFGEGDRPLAELPSGADPGGRARPVNLAPYLAPKTFAALERAYDRAAIARDNFFLALARELLGRSDVEECLRRRDIAPDEFKARVEELLDSPVGNEGGDVSGGALPVLVARACAIARDGGHRFIEPSDLFSALPAADDAAVARLFGMFGMRGPS